MLVVLQGMDTSGKGGVIRHAIGLVDPQGVQLKSFKAPTPEERAHHYLWRIRNAVPSPGMIGIFDRSQYEDVLIVRVESLVPETEWSKRYDEINAFESGAGRSGDTIIKCILHISFEEQKGRLIERLEDPSKHWKYNPGDVDARPSGPPTWRPTRRCSRRCNTEHAPWHVIPVDRKWYRNWAVAELLREHLAALDLQWPSAEFDVEVEKKRVAASRAASGDWPRDHPRRDRARWRAAVRPSGRLRRRRRSGDGPAARIRRHRSRAGPWPRTRSGPAPGRAPRVPRRGAR